MERMFIAVLCFGFYIAFLIYGYYVYDSITKLTNEIKKLVTLIKISEKMRELEIEINEMKESINKGGGQPPSEPSPPPKPS
jgi:hypothetical protein